MSDILHRVGIDATPEQIYAVLTSLEGNKAWWDANAVGDAKKGGVLTFFKGVDMAVVETKPNELVLWKCMKGPAEWLNTEIVFRLVRKDDQTFVMFTHAHWETAGDFMHHCSTKWATFLLSLKALLESGQGRPSPNDVHIEVSKRASSS